MNEPTPQECLDELYKIADRVALCGEDHRKLSVCYRIVSEAILKPDGGDDDSEGGG